MLRAEPCTKLGGHALLCKVQLLSPITEADTGRIELARVKAQRNAQPNQGFNLHSYLVPS